MPKFKKGDIVVGNEASNERYNITTKRSGDAWQVENDYSGNSMRISRLDSSSGYDVKEEFFELRDAPVPVVTNQYQIY